MEQNREPRNKSLHIRSDGLQQECQEKHIDKRIDFLPNGILKMDIHVQKNENEPISHNIQKSSQSGLKT